MKLCYLLPKVKSTLKIPADKHLLQQLEMCVRKLLCQEKDKDVLAIVKRVSSPMPQSCIACEMVFILAFLPQPRGSSVGQCLLELYQYMSECGSCFQRTLRCPSLMPTRTSWHGVGSAGNDLQAVFTRLCSQVTAPQESFAPQSLLTQLLGGSARGSVNWGKDLFPSLEHSLL